jgi:hypothetical protein
VPRRRRSRPRASRRVCLRATAPRPSAPWYPLVPRLCASGRKPMA